MRQAREFFESIRDDVKWIEAARTDIAESVASGFIHGIAYDKDGCAGPHGPASAIDRIIELEAQVAERQAELNRSLDEATAILYGRGGHGGLAKALSTAPADAICGYYLQGMSWREVAADMGSEHAHSWWHVMAGKGLAYLETHSAAALKEMG